MIRNEIVKTLDVECNTTDLYTRLLDSLYVTTDQADNWFKGIIESLFYKPNKYVFVLEGVQAIGKTHFLQHLWYNPYKYIECNEIRVSDLYDNVIINLDFEKKHLNKPMSDFFLIVDNDPPIVDKRLASFCSTTNKWQFPQRKNYIVIKLEKIDWELYNSIDKRLLWIEIFNRFK